MRLSAPTFIVFLIATILAVIALLPVLGVGLPISLPISNFWLMTIAWGLLTAGVVLKGV